MRAAKQLALKLPFRGGKRRGAGRKPKGPRARVRHAKRPRLSRYHPVHITWRVLSGIWNLRGPKCFAEIARAFARGCDRRGFRLIHFSVQGNHLHLIAEATDEVRLSRGLQGLAVRIARGVNRAMGRTGKVFEGRYHEHVLRTVSETAHAVAYVVGNFARHALRRGVAVAVGRPDRCSSAAATVASAPPLVATPQTWLLKRFAG